MLVNFSRSLLLPETSHFNQFFIVESVFLLLWTHISNVCVVLLRSRVACVYCMCESCVNMCVSRQSDDYDILFVLKVTSFGSEINKFENYTHTHWRTVTSHTAYTPSPAPHSISNLISFLHFLVFFSSAFPIPCSSAEWLWKCTRIAHIGQTEFWQLSTVHSIACNTVYTYTDSYIRIWMG